MKNYLSRKEEVIVIAGSMFSGIKSTLIIRLINNKMISLQAIF